MIADIENKIFLSQKNNFEETSLQIFRMQSEHNPVYKKYIEELKIDKSQINSLTDIPFLPVNFFKTQKIKTTNFEENVFFESSGTTETINSRHFVKDISLYKKSFVEGFKKFYGEPEQWCVIGLLPSYLERKNSSLVFMVDELIKMTGHPKSNFYLHDFEKLSAELKLLENEKQKALLIGVTYALLDFAEKYPTSLTNIVVMETGGMKGQRKEITRKEVHDLLKKQFSLSSIHSEYGMTELLSQAYSKNNGVFECPPWMKVLVRNEDDPFDISFTGAGIINIIDLANIYSCSFIATDDAGKIFENGDFEISGRIDGSDLRGCNLLVV
ncbi:MAG TPA: acyl transferase [Puia sp.]|nr:acyl transferase [Puia sp.]